MTVTWQRPADGTVKELRHIIIYPQFGQDNKRQQNRQDGKCPGRQAGFRIIKDKRRMGQKKKERYDTCNLADFKKKRCFHGVFLWQLCVCICSRSREYEKITLTGTL